MKTAHINDDLELGGVVMTMFDLRTMAGVLRERSDKQRGISTMLAAFGVLALQSRGYRKFEIAIAALATVAAACAPTSRLVTPWVNSWNTTLASKAGISTRSSM